MHYLYEYGAMALEDMMHLIEEMRNYRASMPFPSVDGHGMALVIGAFR
jgi:hypothetical protein